MGPPIRRPRKHGGLRTHPDATHGSKRGGRVRHYPRRREGGAGHTAGAEGWGEGPRTHGHSAEETGQRDRGSECGAGGCESTVQLRQWADDYGHRGEEHVDANLPNATVMKHLAAGIV
jgi:hypothetical protein